MLLVVLFLKAIKSHLSKVINMDRLILSHGTIGYEIVFFNPDRLFFSYYYRANKEEKMLKDQFGEEYLNYIKHIERLLVLLVKNIAVRKFCYNNYLAYAI